MGRIDYIYKLLPVIASYDEILVILCGNTISPQIINILVENNVLFKGITGKFIFLIIKSTYYIK
jgi:hypothetical protein